MSADTVLVSDFLRRYPSKCLEFIESQNTETQKKIVAGMSPYQAEIFFRRSRPEFAATMLSSVNSLLGLFERLDPSLLARILSHLEKNQVEALLEKAPPSLKKELEYLSNYPADSAGSLMEKRILLFHPKDSVKQVTKILNKSRGRNIASVFLVNTEGVLQGRVYLQDIITASEDTLLADIAKKTPCVNEMTPKEDIVELVEKHKQSSIPVVDSNLVVVGAIFHEYLVNLAHEDALDGLQTMVGVSKDEKALSPAFFVVRKRLPWLTINLLTTFVAAFVVGMFEETIAKITALAVLLPVVAGQSGNTGAQSQAVTMRGLALREIRLRHKWQVLVKEGSVGALNGLVIGMMCSLSVFFWSQSAPLAIVIGVAMIIAMTAAGLSGAGIPMILTALGQDPATSSSIILTTITDIVGFLSFLGLAAFFSSYLV